jgi:hypothetical protein
MGAEVDASIAQLTALARRGREIHAQLAVDPSAAAPLAAARIWQHDCAAVVSQLSGGNKAHWLSRAYSGALLVRTSGGEAPADASVADIVTRVLGVVDRAARALSQPGAAQTMPSADGAPTRRFDFVRHEPLRPVLEEAYLESARALDEEDYERSLMTTCSVLEAVITDALEATEPDVAALSFPDRIAAAEARRLIRGGCARLPPVARDYRLIADSPPTVVTRRDATVARQVLHVVLKDLDPGR